MLESLALILLIGMGFGFVLSKMKLPNLLGILFTGIILGPYAFNLIDKSILNISTELRTVALVIILSRAGLALDISVLKKVGRVAVLLCFVPACFEMAAMTAFAPIFLNISYIDALLLGSVIAAVSPAVIVPKMLKLMDEGYGKKKGIPEMIMAGASVDDVFVIVVFASVLSLAGGKEMELGKFFQIPTSIVFGVGIGVILGILLVKFFKKYHIRDSKKVLILLSCSFLLVFMEAKVKDIFMISGLLAVMSIGATIFKIYPVLAVRLQSKYNKLWVFAEILLFVLVGATVDISYIEKTGLNAVFLIVIALLFRVLGVFVCMIKTNLDIRERLFSMIAYTPKATVQAAIGGIPLAFGIASGNIILSVAVLSIIITAPIGAFLIDVTYKKFLKSEIKG